MKIGLVKDRNVFFEEKYFGDRQELETVFERLT